MSASAWCQTRVWNLMIDVIAQSGRYPQGTANLSQFQVEGESDTGFISWPIGTPAK